MADMTTDEAIAGSADARVESEAARVAAANAIAEQRASEQARRLAAQQADTASITGATGIQGQLNPRADAGATATTPPAASAAAPVATPAQTPAQTPATAQADLGTERPQVVSMDAIQQRLSPAQQAASERYNANAKRVGGGADLSSRGTVVSPAAPGSASERATAGENARRMGSAGPVAGRPTARPAAAQGGVAASGGAVAPAAGETGAGGAAGATDDGGMRVTRESTGPKGTTVTRTRTPTQERIRQLAAIPNAAKTPEHYQEGINLMVQDFNERVKALEGKPTEMAAFLRSAIEAHSKAAPDPAHPELGRARLGIVADAKAKLDAIEPERVAAEARSQSAVASAQEAQIKAMAAVPETLAKLSTPAPHETDGGIRAITSAGRWLVANKAAMLANKTLTQEQFDQYHGELLGRLTDAQTEHHKAESEKKKVGVEKELDATIKAKGAKNLGVGFFEGEMSNAYAQKADYLERAIKATALTADGRVVSTLTEPAKDRLKMELRIAKEQQRKWQERKDKEDVIEGVVRGTMGAVGKQYLSGNRLSVGDMQKATTAMTVGALKAGMTPDYKKASEAYNKSVENTAKYDYMMDDRGKHPDKYQYDPATGTITDVSDPKNPVVVTKPDEKAENALYEKMREMLDRTTAGSVDKSFAATEQQPAQQQ
jgi:hypothetical protein